VILRNGNKPFILFLAAVVAITAFIAIALKFLLPFIIGIFIAFLIDPMVSLIEKKFRLDRGMVVGVVLTAIFCLFGYVFTLIITRLTFELSKLIYTLPNYSNYYNMVFDRITAYLVYFSTKIPEDILEYVKNNLNQILSAMTGFLSNIYSFLMNKVTMVPNLFINLFVFLIFVFLFSYFFSKDKNKILKFLMNILPKTLQEKIKNVQIELFLSFINMIKAQIILVMISTTITILGLYILKVDYALTLGIICGLLDILPLFGPSLIFIPWIIFSVIMGNISFAMGLLILYVIMIGSRQIFQAKIISQNLGIDPLLTLISIYLGIEIFGFMGLFIGPLVVVIMRALLHSGVIPPLCRNK